MHFPKKLAPTTPTTTVSVNLRKIKNGLLIMYYTEENTMKCSTCCTHLSLSFRIARPTAVPSDWPTAVPDRPGSKCVIKWFDYFISTVFFRNVSEDDSVHLSQHNFLNASARLLLLFSLSTNDIRSNSSSSSSSPSFPGRHKKKNVDQIIWTR
jgi:hypothetical protein